jgi:hypothetical protein
MIPGTALDWLKPGLARRAARVCGFPPVSVPELGTWSDREAWRVVLDRATPAEEFAILQQLEAPLMESSPAGASRLRHARDLGSWRDDVSPLVYGDAELLPRLRQALALMPPEVASNACRSAAWVGIGPGTNAMTMSANFVGEDGVRRERLVLAALERADVLTLCHEAAHLWHAPHPGAPAAGCAIKVDGQAALRELALRQGWYRQIEREEQAEETRADALSLIWVFRAPQGAPA